MPLPRLPGWHLTLLASTMGPKLRSFSVQSAVTLPKEKYRDSRVLVIAAGFLHFIPTALLVGSSTRRRHRLPAHSRPSAPIPAGSCLSRRPSRFRLPSTISTIGLFHTSQSRNSFPVWNSVVSMMVAISMSLSPAGSELLARPLRILQLERERRIHWGH